MKPKILRMPPMPKDLISEWSHKSPMYIDKSDKRYKKHAKQLKTNGFSEWLLVRKEALLKCPSDYAAFLQELTLSKRVGDDLLNTQKLAERGVVKIQQLLTTRFNEKISPLLIASGAESFKKYSAAASILIFMNAAARMDGHREALETFIL